MTIESESLDLTGGRSYFLPGETLGGTAHWRREGRLRRAEVQLVRVESGKGGQAAEVVAVVPFDLPRPSDDRLFEIVLPDGPYSFRGQLFTLSWEVRLVLDEEAVVSEAVVLSPTRQPMTGAGVG